MKPTIHNLPRSVAVNFSEVPENTVWIAIGEPESTDKFNIAANLKSKLAALPNLRIDFWDILEDTYDIISKENIPAPSYEDAFKIVEFLLDNQGKNVIVNCRAGVSRSAAVCKFCEECLGYIWSTEYQKKVSPNQKLVGLLKAAYRDYKKKYFL